MIKIDVKVLSVTPQVQHHLLRGAYRYLQSTAGIELCIRGGGTGPADPAAAGPIQEHTVKNFFHSFSQRNKVLTYSSKRPPCNYFHF